MNHSGDDLVDLEDAIDDADLGDGAYDQSDDNQRLLAPEVKQQPKKTKTIGFLKGYCAGWGVSVMIEVVFVCCTLFVNSHEVVLVTSGVALVAAFLAWFSLRKVSHKKWIVVCVSAASAGIMGGLWSSVWFDQWYQYHNNQAYVDVNPEVTDPSDYAEASTLSFNNITRVHYEIGGATETSNGWACTAPLQSMDDTPALAVSFYAVDTECCSGSDASSWTSSCASWARNEDGESLYTEGEIVSCEPYLDAVVSGEIWFGYTSYQGFQCLSMAAPGDHAEEQEKRLTYAIVIFVVTPTVWPLFFGVWYLLAFCTCTIATLSLKKAKKEKKAGNV